MVQLESHAKSIFIVVNLKIAKEINHNDREIYGSLSGTLYNCKIHFENYVSLCLLIKKLYRNIRMMLIKSQVLN